MFTDGLMIESRNIDGHNLRQRKNRRSFRSNRRDDRGRALEHIMQVVGDFSGDEPAADDVTVIIARKL